MASQAALYQYMVEDGIFDPYHEKFWWAAWLSTWVAIALAKELGEKCSYPYMRAFAQNLLQQNGRLIPLG